MRYLPHTEADRQHMLRAIGVPDIQALFEDVPETARLDPAHLPFDLPDHMSEAEVTARLSRLARGNLDGGTAPSFLGAGSYRHFVPAAVDHLIQRGEFLTSYTPYQPEVSQGTLQYLFEFQTQVALLAGLDVANASMYDGATSCVEAIMMANRITRREKVVISGALHPHYRAVAETYGRLTGFALDVAETRPGGAEDLSARLDGDVSCVVVQNPDAFGQVRDLAPLAEACHAAGALLVVVVTEAVSLGLLKSPGEMGADVLAAEGQSLGNAMNFGGPHVGLFATRDKFLRQMPGRLCGETKDADGRRGYVLTLSTREQHIRREKATSNICTNSGLCALAFTIHLSLLGEEGLAKLARLNHARAVQLAEKLAAIPGVEVVTDRFFNEFTLRLPENAATAVERMAAAGVLGGVPASRLWPGAHDIDNFLLVAVTETNTDDDMDRLGTALARAVRDSRTEVSA